MKLVIWLVLIVAVADGIYVFFGAPHPYVLTRFTADAAIEQTAEFQHKTKLFFEVGQSQDARFPAACHNFEFSEGKFETMKRYLTSGKMKFTAYKNRTPPFPPASAGSLDLAAGPGFLVDHIDVCMEHPVQWRTQSPPSVQASNDTIGAYELTLGNPVVEVTGVRKGNGRASVEFRWHFQSLNPVGRSLARVQATTVREESDEHLTPKEKASAPFWVGTAEFAEYDDGWRVVTIKLDAGRPGERWEYGPAWPDPSFNWNAFDENQNR